MLEQCACLFCILLAQLTNSLQTQMTNPGLLGLTVPVCMLAGSGPVSAGGTGPGPGRKGTQGSCRAAGFCHEPKAKAGPHS